MKPVKPAPSREDSPTDDPCIRNSKNVTLAVGNEVAGSVIGELGMDRYEPVLRGPPLLASKLAKPSTRMPAGGNPTAP
jgi:hypothetical protein